MHRALNVTAMANNMLLIEFDTGEKKTFDCSKLIEKSSLYKDLSDETYFRKVYVDEMGIVSWEDAVNLDPYMVYEESIATKEINCDK